MDDNNPWQPAVNPLAKVAHTPKPDVQDSILAQVARQLESETKWVQVDKTPIQGIKLWVMKEFHIPWLNRDHLDYCLSKCKGANNKVNDTKENDNKENDNKENKPEPHLQPAPMDLITITSVIFIYVWMYT